MILPPHHTLNFLSLSIEKSIKCRTGPGNDFVAICKFGNFPQRLQKQNANDLWDNIPQKDKWEADEGLPWSAPQFPSQKTKLLPYMRKHFEVYTDLKKREKERMYMDPKGRSPEKKTVKKGDIVH